MAMNLSPGGAARKDMQGSDPMMAGAMAGMREIVQSRFPSMSIPQRKALALGLVDLLNYVTDALLKEDAPPLPEPLRPVVSNLADRSELDDPSVSDVPLSTALTARQASQFDRLIEAARR